MPMGVKPSTRSRTPLFLGFFMPKGSTDDDTLYCSCVFLAKTDVLITDSMH